MLTRAPLIGLSPVDIIIVGQVQTVCLSSSPFLRVQGGPMRPIGFGKYRCGHCGEALTIPERAAPVVTIRMSSGSPALRSISYQGKEIHSCPAGGPLGLKAG